VTYSQQERSRVGGAPIELVQFISGSSAWRLTGDVDPQAHLGQGFTPTEMRVGPVRQTDEADAGSVVVSLPRDHELADLLLSGLLYDPVAVTVFRRHRPSASAAVALEAQLEDPTLSPPTIAPFTGQVSQAAISGGELVITCTPLQALLQIQIPQRVVSRLCPHMQYGVACGLSLEDWLEPHVVTAISPDGMTLTIPTLFDLGFADGVTHFPAGILRFNGRHRMVVSQAGTDLRLLGPMPGLVVDDTVEIAASCERQVVRCHVQFNNLRHFGGFPGMPDRNPFAERLI
jgi:hypothetical protein